MATATWSETTIKTTNQEITIPLIEGYTGDTFNRYNFPKTVYGAVMYNGDVDVRNNYIISRNTKARLEYTNFYKDSPNCAASEIYEGVTNPVRCNVSGNVGIPVLCIIHNLTTDKYMFWHAEWEGYPSVVSYQLGTAGNVSTITYKSNWDPQNITIGTPSDFNDNVARAFMNLSVGYEIVFQTNGGTPVPTLESQTNLPDPLPTTTRDGYIFTGWYTDSSLIFPAIPGAVIIENTTLYAGWRPAEFTITFNTNGGEPIGHLTKQNHLPDPLPIPVKQGNTFAGWFTDSTLLTPAVPGAAISRNTTLYAKWEEIRSTDIHVPAVNTPSLLQTGFVTMWKPTLEEVRSLADFLWTTNIFDNLRKLFNDPMEAVLFLGIVPCDMTTGERGNIFFGNLDSDVESSPVTQQYYTFDFGDISLVEYYNSFLDYEPNTFAEIFLPFCGTHRLSINEIMGATINVKYNVDIFTGTCVAMLTITKPGVDSVMYSFEGNIMATIPVTAKSYSDFLRSAVTAVASGLAMGMML